jgi:hypothetical protein
MRWILGGVCVALAIGAGAIYWTTGLYGFNVVLHRGGSIWLASSPSDPRLSPSMKLALTDSNPNVTPGDLSWREIRPGFQVSELAALAGGREVDRIALVRIDPARFRFAVKNRPSGDTDLQGWMKLLGAALVINGSYFSNRGTPSTPFLSDGVQSGPPAYNATHGAFVASASSAGVEDLATKHWNRAFAGTDNAMVSYPMLIGSDGNSRVTPSNWLASRSFVAEDADGYIVLGTTADGFFSLSRLADFLRQSPLKLKTALNLDGGPVACQGISLDGFVRDLCGKYEMRHEDGRYELLVQLFGERRATMPIVLAVFPR